MKIPCLATWLSLIAILVEPASGASVFTFGFPGDPNYDSGSVLDDDQLLSFTLGNSGHDGEFLKNEDRLSPILLQSLAVGSHFQGARVAEYSGVISPEQLIGVYNFNDLIFTSVTHPDQQQINPHLELVDFAYNSLSFTPGPAPIPVALFNFQGGPSSAPIFLPSGVPVSEITGTIGGLGSQDYYSFVWAGGAFSATGSITGTDAFASYLFSGGLMGDCNSSGSATLDSDDTFAATIAVANLAPGQYCIGITSTSPHDPTYTLNFITPVNGFLAPEPSVFVLLSVGFGIIAVLRLSKRGVRA